MIGIGREGTIDFAIERPEARAVSVVGAFEGWHEEHIPLHRDETGCWRVTVRCRPGVVLFRYLVDGKRWELDPDAHGSGRSADGILKSRVFCPPEGLDADSIAA